MHEFSTAVSIVETITDVARKNNATKIKKIELVVGDFSMLNYDQLTFSFEIAAEGTLAEGAEVIIEAQRGQIECKDCQYVGPIEKANEEVDHLVVDLVNIFECPKCKSNKTKISGGRDVFVKNIEVELPSDDE
ncbi:MAG: hydrogenase maturation nickel metallochaperone HypA [Candidatus Heimdallarchaeota archaeon]